MSIQREEVASLGEARVMISEMVSRYARQRGHPPSYVAEELAEPCGCTSKTVKRDWGMDGRKLTDPTPLRVEKYARWLFEKAKYSPSEIAQWLDLTDYPQPGELLLKITTGKQEMELYRWAKSNSYLPPLKQVLLTDGFLGRDEETAKARSWADSRERFPLAVLHGFGGSGKSTLQLKLGHDFLVGPSCRLRWPYEGVVWIPANDPAFGLPSVWRAIAKAFQLGDATGRETGNRQWLEGAVRQLLEEKRVLALIDNFETLTPATQVEILKFIGGLKGSSKALISSRRLDTELLDRNGLRSQTLHIKVEGLSPEHTRSLIEAFFIKEGIPTGRFPQSELDRLAAVTENNPQAIIVALGVCARGWRTLAQLLDAITTGRRGEEVDKIFAMIIGEVWEELAGRDKSVLMAKAFFERPVRPYVLGCIAGVGEHDLKAAVDTLESISFLVKKYPECPERGGTEDWRVSTHQLAQAFAHSKLQNDPAALKRMERRWWRAYAPDILEASKTGYDSVNTELSESIDDVLAHIEKHLADERSPYRAKAVELFLHGVAARPGTSQPTSHGIGHVLRYWGKWDALIRVAKLCLSHIEKKKNPALIRECALRLLARAHNERREIEEAERCIASAEVKNAELNDKWLEAAILYSRGEITRQQGKFSLAKDYLQAALKLFQRFGEQRDVAPTSLVLGGCIIELAVQHMNVAVVDGGSPEEEGLREAEGYLNRAERLLKSRGVNYPEKRFDAASVRAFKAVIARLRGDNRLARELFQSCEGQFPSISSVVRLKLERALVERLDNNRELAHELEAEALARMAFIGLTPEHLPDYHYNRMIRRMKDTREW